MTELHPHRGRNTENYTDSRRSSTELKKAGKAQETSEERCRTEALETLKEEERARNKADRTDRESRSRQISDTRQ